MLGKTKAARTRPLAPRERGFVNRGLPLLQTSSLDGLRIGESVENLGEGRFVGFRQRFGFRFG